MHAIISIHDVEPKTLPLVKNIIQTLPKPCQTHLTLLVIPGKNWLDQHIEQLQDWQAQGITLAGHGWHHDCTRINGFYHRLHSTLISRNAAEHLALSTNAISDLLHKNHSWFKQHNLNPPRLYVPPAWAMGRITREQLSQAPFRYFENTSGIYDSELKLMRYLPLIGFEADTTLRQSVLGAWNRMNRCCQSRRRPLRVSIHPKDLQLKLKQQLLTTLAKVTHTYTLDSLFESQSQHMQQAR